MRIVLFFLTTFYTLIVFAEGFTCNDAVKKSYVKGNYSSSNARDKIFKFKNLRDDLMLEIDNGLPNGDKASCLLDFYDKSMKESAEYWGKRQSEDSCTEACQIELAKSTTYLENLDNELRTRIKIRLPAAEKALAAKTKADEICGTKAADSANDLANLKNNMCCGEAGQNGTGAVRAVYPEISYQACLVKTQPTKDEILSAGGLADCVSNIVVQALKTLWHNIKAIAAMPGELWAARDQIWQIMTNADARKAFTNKFIGAINQFIKTRSAALGSCLNQYEQSQYICRMSGTIIGHIATPLVMAKALKLLSSGVSAGSSFLAEALAQTPRGQQILNTLNKAKTAGQSAMTAARTAKTAATESAKKSAKAAAELSKKSLTKLFAFSQAKETFKTRLNAAIEKHGNRKPASEKVTEPTTKVQGESPDPATTAKVDTEAKADIDTPAEAGPTSAVQSTEITAARGQEVIESSRFLGQDRAEFMKAVKEHNIQPSQTVNVGNAKVSLSEPFDIGGGRVASIAVVENGGVITTQVYYRSNSQGVFRLLPGTTEKGWFSKGVGESSLDAPSEIQKALSAKVASGQIRTDVPKNLFEKAVPKYDTAFDAMVAAGKDPALNINRIQVLSETPATVRSGATHHVKPQDLKLANPKNSPDFSGGTVTSYETSTGAAGKVTAKVFKSKNGDLEYTFFEDSSGRAWIASVDNVRAPINSAGIRSASIETGDLTMPRFEYHKQIPSGYQGKGRFGQQGEYGDTWPYLKQNPLIQEYYSTRGLEVPE